MTYNEAIAIADRYMEGDKDPRAGEAMIYLLQHACAYYKQKYGD